MHRAVLVLLAGCSVLEPAGPRKESCSSFSYDNTTYVGACPPGMNYGCECCSFNGSPPITYSCTNGCIDKVFDDSAYCSRRPESEGDWTALSANGEDLGFVCGLKTGGEIFCWGSGDFYGETRPPSSKYIAVAAGAHHGCALLSLGSPVCWGSNSHGQTRSPSGAYAQISAGGYHSCAVAADGSAVCWGAIGQPPAVGFRKISSGVLHACGVKTDGGAACWGSNDQGQTVVPDGQYLDISAGDGFTCAVRADGSLACWGRSFDGQPRPPSDTDFTAVTTGRRHACALRSGGQIACWGAGATNSGCEPNCGQSAAPAGTFVEVAAGSYFTCARRADGHISCWGARR